MTDVPAAWSWPPPSHSLVLWRVSWEDGQPFGMWVTDGEMGSMVSMVREARRRNARAYAGNEPCRWRALPTGVSPNA